LVRQGHLACATVAGGARAVYVWKGALREEPSVLLWGKTSTRAAARAIAALRALHPDEVPEILAFRASGALRAYADWVSTSTRRTR
jgi:periplasmic divalent cation tolerance protein